MQGERGLGWKGKAALTMFAAKIARDALILSALSLAACAPSDQDSRSDAVILGGGAVSAMLRQCSRDTPARGEDSWRPSWKDIAPMEAALPKALADPSASAIRYRNPRDWRRQYVGIVRNGRRFIYGNYFPNSFGGDYWRKKPVNICDGGSKLFGAEYDVEARRIDHLSYNGDG
jgi:hypothetical protein